MLNDHLLAVTPINFSKWKVLKKSHLNVVFFVSTCKVVFVSWHAFKLQANVTRWLTFWSETKNLSSSLLGGGYTNQTPDLAPQG